MLRGANTKRRDLVVRRGRNCIGGRRVQGLQQHSPWKLLSPRDALVCGDGVPEWKVLHWGTDPTPTLRSWLVFLLWCKQLHAVHYWQVFSFVGGECVHRVRRGHVFHSDWSLNPSLNSSRCGIHSEHERYGELSRQLRYYLFYDYYRGNEWKCLGHW